MRYLIAGSGGTGGATGAFLHLAGKDVTFLARGKHLEAMREEGLSLHSGLKGECRLFPVKAFNAQEIMEDGQTFDVIFVCTKSYSIDSIVPLLKAASHKDTVVIPILNVYGTGEKLQEMLPGITVLDGCIYIVAYLNGPGNVVQSGDIFRIVYGEREENPACHAALAQVTDDLAESGIRGIWSKCVKWDTFRKYSFICAYATAGAYFDIPAAAMQQEGEARALVKALFGEMQQLAHAMGLEPDTDLVAENIAIVDAMSGDATASMQKDMKAGKETEIDGLTFQAVRLGRKYGITLPEFERTAAQLGFPQA